MTTQVNTVSLNVNEKALIANLKNIFTNTKLIYPEIMQNARRAGASKIRFESPAEWTLVITDDGVGCDDLQNLFSVATSGWDEQTQEKEKPFGFGFIIALYACESITIESQGQKVFGRCHDIINGETLTVLDSDVTKGMKLTLNGFKYTSAQTEKHVKSYAMYQSMDVLWNNRKVETPYGYRELKARGFDEVLFEYGTIMIPNCVTLKHENILQEQYIAGSHIQRTGYDDEFLYNHNVVFLDSSRVEARMPDRASLLEDCTREVNLALRLKLIEIHREKLIRLRQELNDDEKFVELYDHSIREVDIKLYNDISYLPKGAFSYFSDYPDTCLSSENSNGTSHMRRTLSREELESRPLVCFDYSDVEQPFTTHMYLYKKQALMLEMNLDNDHWVYDSLVDADDSETWFVSINYENESARITHLSFEVVFVEDITLDGPFGQVTFSDDAVYSGEIVIPKDERNASVMIQAVNVVGEYSDIDQDYAEELENQLEMAINQVRSTTAKSILDFLLRMDKYGELGEKFENESFSVKVINGRFEILNE